MYKKILTVTALAIFTLFMMDVSTARAGSVTIPNTFTSGTTAVAEEVNANFDAIDTAVDDNDSRITALETLVATLQSTITTLQTDLAAKADTSHTHAQSDVTDLTTDLTAKAATTHAHAQSDVTDLAADLNTLTNNVTTISGNSVLQLDNYLILTTENGHDTAQFNSINVQVTNGTGSQTTINGLGNLIVGYNEAHPVNDVKTGSHNLVAGNQNSYSNYGGVVFGFNNIVSNIYSSVSGGRYNTASGDYSSVSGGYGNTASVSRSSVSGGMYNTASGALSSVSGGAGNTASHTYSSILGGNTTSSSADYEAVLGTP